MFQRRFCPPMLVLRSTPRRSCMIALRPSENMALNPRTSKQYAYFDFYSTTVRATALEHNTIAGMGASSGVFIDSSKTLTHMSACGACIEVAMTLSHERVDIRKEKIEQCRSKKNMKYVENENKENRVVNRDVGKCEKLGQKRRRHEWK